MIPIFTNEKLIEGYIVSSLIDKIVTLYVLLFILFQKYFTCDACVIVYFE